MDCIAWYASPLGRLLMASDGAAITGLWFEGQRRFARGLGDAREEARLPVLDAAARWLDVYFSGSEPDFAPPVRARGTAFEQAVWAELMKIPYGQTATYGDVARALGLSAGAARAVGGAVGRNPISILIPCHRVVGAGGRLGGYAGGLDKKRALLTLEGATQQKGTRSNDHTPRARAAL